MPPSYSVFWMPRPEVPILCSAPLSDLLEKLVDQKVSSLSLDSQKLDTSSFSLDTVYERLRLGAGASPVDYRYSAIHAEAQTLSYSAQGTLKLEDGTELSFNFQVEASRVYVEETRARVRIDGSRFQDMLGTNIPGISVRSRENGADIALDHQGVRQLLEGLKDAQPGQGRRHAYGHDLRGGVVENAAHQGQGVKQHAADVSA